jgi:hypothetical protein
MTRNHRRWHAWFWLILGPLLVAGFVVGLLARPAPVYEWAPEAGGTKDRAVETRPPEEKP